MRTPHRRQAGAQAVEYALLVAVLSMGLAMSMTALRPPLCDMIASVSELLGNPSGLSCTGSAGAGGGHTNNGRGDGNGNGNGNGNNGNGNGDANGKGWGVNTP